MSVYFSQIFWSDMESQKPNLASGPYFRFYHQKIQNRNILNWKMNKCAKKFDSYNKSYLYECPRT